MGVLDKAANKSEARDFVRVCLFIPAALKALHFYKVNCKFPGLYVLKRGHWLLKGKLFV